MPEGASLPTADLGVGVCLCGELLMRHGGRCLNAWGGSWRDDLEGVRPYTRQAILNTEWQFERNKGWSSVILCHGLTWTYRNSHVVNHHYYHTTRKHQKPYWVLIEACFKQA